MSKVTARSRSEEETKIQTQAGQWPSVHSSHTFLLCSWEKMEFRKVTGMRSSTKSCTWSLQSPRAAKQELSWKASLFKLLAWPTWGTLEESLFGSSPSGHSFCLVIPVLMPRPSQGFSHQQIAINNNNVLLIINTISNVIKKTKKI